MAPVSMFPVLIKRGLDISVLRPFLPLGEFVLHPAPATLGANDVVSHRNTHNCEVPVTGP